MTNDELGASPPSFVGWYKQMELQSQAFQNLRRIHPIRHSLFEKFVISIQLRETHTATSRFNSISS